MRLKKIAISGLVIALAAWLATNGKYSASYVRRSEVLSVPQQAIQQTTETSANAVATRLALPNAQTKSGASSAPVYASDAYVYAIEREGTRASAIVNALLPLAQQGNAAALYALRRLRDRCVDFHGDPRSRARVSAPAGSEDAQWQAKVIEVGQAFCDDTRLHTPPTSSLFSRETWRLLRERGDEIAMAQSLVPDWQIGQQPAFDIQAKARSAAWDLAMRSQNPYAVEAALTALAGLPEDIDGPIWPLTHEATELFPGDHRRMRVLAAMWYACELGADCRPYGTWQQRGCLHQRNCAPQLPLQDFIRERMLTPSQYAAMQRYLDVIRAERAKN